MCVLKHFETYLYNHFPQKSRSRPPSYAGGDSPVALRSRSSTCDSIQSGSSPSSTYNPIPGGGQRTANFPNTSAAGNYGQPGSSPKQQQQMGAGSTVGGSSPNSMSSSLKNLTQTPTNSGSRKSLIVASKLEVSYLFISLGLWIKFILYLVIC